MIIAKIIGGLGNQMFQYAAGFCLAHLNNTQLKLDLSGFEEYGLRNFDLKSFNIHYEVATDEEIMELRPSRNLEKVLQYLSPREKRTYYREKYFHFDEKIFLLGSNIYLKGYFQSEKYFHPAKDMLRQEFNFKEAVISNVREFSRKLLTSNSVSVHIRHGDMKKDSASRDYHGVLPIDYYKKSIAIIQSKIRQPTFYFFSDDINWVKENLSFPDAVYVSDNITKNHLEDIYLMSQCRHNIIANSSFSWWGAWLNDNPGKMVIAPKNWFNKGPKDTYDLYPVDWMII